MPVGRLRFLDGLRGLAATWVVLFHFGAGRQIDALLALLPGWAHTAFIDWGYLGVAVFFVLSGYVIAHTVGEVRMDGSFVARFLTRRSVRLALPYWASIAFTLVVLTVKAGVRPGTNSPSLDVGNLAAHLLYLQDLLGLPAISEVYWTLCFEMQFYLLFCACLFLADIRQRPTASAMRPRSGVFALAAMVGLAWPLIDGLQLRGLSLPYWHCFLLGVFICWTLQARMAFRWLALYASGVLVLYGITRQDYTLTALLTGTVITLTGVTRRLDSLLRGAAVQFLGRISYSLYLLHIPVSGGTFAITGLFLGESVAERLLALAIVVTVNLTVAYVAWRIIEQPSTMLARRLTQSAAAVQ